MSPPKLATPSLESGRKRGQLLKALTARVARGEFPAAGRFPSFEILAGEYAASKATLQYVVDEMKALGYLRGLERKGLYVAPCPPCHHRFALLLQSNDDSNSFWKKMAGRRPALRRSLDVELEVLPHVESPGFTGGTALAGRVAARAVGGLILPFPPRSRELGAIMADAGIPKVLLGAEAAQRKNPSVIPVDFDIAGFVRMAMEDFQRLGVRRAALLMMEHQPSEGHFLSEAARLAFSIEPFHVQVVSTKSPADAENVVRLLLALPEGRRPQSLLINDENLRPHAIRGLLASGVRAGDHFPVCSHVNFPDASRDALPVRALGFDTAELMDRAVEAMRHWHRDGRHEPIRLAPRWQAGVAPA